MIWNDSIFPAGHGLEILTRHIAAEIRSAGSDFSDSAGMLAGNELARSVAEFVFHSEAFALMLRNESERARHSAGVLIPSDYLLIMTCRALWAIGEEQTARALLRTKGPELNISESYADAVFADDLFPGLGIHSALVRALRPSSSVWSLNGPYWVLNLRTVFSFLDAGLELTVWRILHALIKQLAALWDVSNGKGTLGLRNSRFISVNILGFPCKSRQGRRFTAEALCYCEQDLKMAAGKRSWRFTPAIMDLDA
ncbi:MAG: hypothetical protein Q7J98_12440 [Kiritimatiellia bacterium]|nr:hypothetical protein [Kiritimatiellia bacterium]